jgi:HlyD family secretion protein
MNHKKPPVPVIVIFIIVILVGGYYGVKALTSNGSQPLLVSGTIEANEITISSEIPGKVAEVYVDEGAQVKSGDPLFRMDDSLLKAQKDIANAGLKTANAALSTARSAVDTAQDNYTLAFNAARLEASASRTLDWNSIDLPGYSLPQGYFSLQELIDAAQVEVSSAHNLADEKKAVLDIAMGETGSLSFLSAEKDLLAARMAEQTALDVLNRANLSPNLDLRNAAQTAYDDAKAQTESAQSAYDELKSSDYAVKIITARLDFAVAEEWFETAQDILLKLQVGVASPKLKAAYALVNQVQLAASQAESAVAQAETQLAFVDLQISKLTITAPADGVILTRSVEPGEMVSAAAAAFKIGKLFDLYITVYVPEEIYGTLSIGQMASLSVDSFPGESFSARIVNIADQAEFTPRNIQTVEGRKSTVFAVKLKLVDLLGRLKPGMPADITFSK